MLYIHTTIVKFLPKPCYIYLVGKLNLQNQNFNNQ